MNKILLLGDSLTEHGYQNLWVAKLQDAFRRRADVVNRGLSGYNTAWVRSLLMKDKLIPRELQRSVGTNEAAAYETLFVTIFFGANDAVGPSFPQHVSLQDFEANLEFIVETVQRVVRPTKGIILITPPPICEEKYLKFVQETRDASVTQSNRTLLRTQQYRDVVRSVAEKYGDQRVFVVDLYDAFLGDDGVAAAVERAPWWNMFYDGLHFDTHGGEVVFQKLMRCIETQLGVVPERDIAMDLPHWSTL